MIHTPSSSHHGECTIHAPLEPTNDDSIVTLPLRVAVCSVRLYTADLIQVLSSSRNCKLCGVSPLSVACVSREVHTGPGRNLVKYD